MPNQDQYDIPKTVYFGAEDTSFVAGDSPATHDVNTTLERNSVSGYIYCDGAGDIIIAFSEDGTNYGNNVRMKNGETFVLRSLSIDTIKVTHSGSDSAYRIFAV